MAESITTPVRYDHRLIQCIQPPLSRRHRRQNGGKILRAGTEAKDSGIGVDARSKLTVYFPLVFFAGESHWPFAGTHKDGEGHKALPFYYRDLSRRKLVASEIAIESQHWFWSRWAKLYDIDRKLFPFVGDKDATFESLRGALREYTLVNGRDHHTKVFPLKGNKHIQIYEDLVACATNLDPALLEDARIPLRSVEAAEPINPEYGGSAFLYCLCQRSDVNTFMETFLNVGGIAAIVGKSFSDREKGGGAPGHVYGFELYKNIWEASFCLVSRQPCDLYWCRAPN